MPVPLIASDVVKFFGDRRVLDGVHLTAHPGQRTGLVGENGAGKTTLLRLLAGLDTPDAGEINRPPDLGLLDQEPPFAPAETVGDVMHRATWESRHLLRRLDELLAPQPERRPPAPPERPVPGHPQQRTLTTPDHSAPTTLDRPALTTSERLAEYGDVLTRAEEVDAWGADRRADEVMCGLGLSRIARDRHLSTISGGQRSRVALAALLVRRPGALLLDEPTNHLDDQALSFVESQLRGVPGVVVVASHDRVFLDQVCTDIVDIDPARAGVTRYRGAYAGYLRAKRAERRRWERAFADQQEEMNALRLAIRTTARRVAPGRAPRDGNKVGYHAHGEKVQASLSSRVRSARQRLEVLRREQVRKPPAVLRFRAPPMTTPDAGEGHLARCAASRCRTGSAWIGWTWCRANTCW